MLLISVQELADGNILPGISGGKYSLALALGHHLDDFTETTIMNLCFRGNFSTMNPVQEFYNGKIYILRPMCGVRENVIHRMVKECDIPVSVFNCP